MYTIQYVWYFGGISAACSYCSVLFSPIITINMYTNYLQCEMYIKWSVLYDGEWWCWHYHTRRMLQYNCFRNMFVYYIYMDFGGCKISGECRFRTTIQRRTYVFGVWTILLFALQNTFVLMGYLLFLFWWSYQVSGSGVERGLAGVWNGTVVVIPGILLKTKWKYLKKRGRRIDWIDSKTGNEHAKESISGTKFMPELCFKIASTGRQYIIQELGRM